MTEQNPFKFKLAPTMQAGCGCTPPANPGGACCGPADTPKAVLSNIQLKIPVEPVDPKAVPRVSDVLTRSDRWGAFKVRWGVGRMSYTVQPGLYALGAPDANSEVLVTANYKLTFDVLRSTLAGLNFWILVIDTKGINVWCAAGKGTFGTEELVRRIEASGLASVVRHRRVIVPQLGAPGVAAHTVKAQSGFKVVYGPIEAADIPAFLEAGMKASAAMREKTFSLRERIVLIPVELVSAFKGAVFLAAVFALLSGLLGPNGFWDNALRSGVLAAGALFAALLGGAVLTPMLLPVLPGRPFSIKSLPLGILLGAATVLGLGSGFASTWSALESSAWLLIVPALTAYLAMNFTGASTYTSLSGVKKEMKYALPVQIGAAVLGIALWTASRIIA